MRNRAFRIAIVGLLAAPAAHAGFSVEARVSDLAIEDTSYPNTPKHYDQDSYADTFPDAAGTLSAGGFVADGGSAGQAQARARFGQLSASSTAACSTAFTGAQGSGRGNAEVQDTIHIHSGSLANGAPIQLDFSMAVHASGSGPGTNSYGEPFASLDAGSLHLEYSDGVSDLSGTLDAQVGEDVTITYTADAHSFVDGEAGGGTFASVDAQPRIHANSANPDVTFATDSGYDYGLPVPEPTGTASAEIGILSLVALAMRSRPRSS